MPKFSYVRCNFDRCSALWRPAVEQHRSQSGRGPCRTQRTHVRCRPGASYGTLLCLNVNDSSKPAADGNTAPAVKLRVFASVGPGQQRTIGSVPVDADGSVIVRLPVDVALGLDTLDAQGNVLRHQPAFLSLGPGRTGRA